MGQSSVKPEGYLPRIVDEQVERYLRIFGAVEIEGTKWCGKTWTARSEDGNIIPKGKMARIVRMEGVKLYVRESKEPSERRE